MNVNRFLAYLEKHALDVAAARERARRQGLLTQVADVLLGGNLLLLADDESRRATVTALDTNSGVANRKFFVAEESGSEVIGVDVDATGQTALVLWQLGDFPQLILLDATGRSLADLDCTELIDGRITDPRFSEDVTRIHCINDLTDGEMSLIVDLNEKIVHWIEEM